MKGFILCLCLCLCCVVLCFLFSVFCFIYSISSGFCALGNWLNKIFITINLCFIDFWLLFSLCFASPCFGNHVICSLGCRKFDKWESCTEFEKARIFLRQSTLFSTSNIIVTTTTKGFVADNIFTVCLAKMISLRRSVHSNW